MDSQEQAKNDFYTQIFEQNPFVKDMFSSSEAQASLDSMANSWQQVVSSSSEGFSEWLDLAVKYQQDAWKLWGSFFGVVEAPAVKADRRFGAEEWNDNPVANFIKQAYLLTGDMLSQSMKKLDLPDTEQRKIEFYVQQAVDTFSPSNFVVTNPEVINRAMETNGQSLMDGFQNLLNDMQTGAITTSDPTAFTLGENIAATPGSVIFKNELIELIQYAPATAEVYDRPMLVLPPCVNKFYIFDINERKSWVKYAVEQGRTVFMISWRNATKEMADCGWDEYLEQGVFKAVETALSVAKAKQLDLVSWCNGGSFAVAALAAMTPAQRKKVATVNLQATMIDFSDPGEVDVFIDDPQVGLYGQKNRQSGVVPGGDLAKAMAMLHANDSIWNFFVNNYLMGKTPPPFDVLHWNADTNNMTSKWYNFYVENMYQQNLLKEPGGVTLLGKPVDVRDIDIPCYFLSATGDHIVPWQGSYGSSSLVTGESEFVLTDGGHVSGTVINHPVKTRRKFWVDGDRSKDADGWQASATLNEGSWWTHYYSWLDKHSGDKVAAPKKPGSTKFPVLEAAPGSYVREEVPQNF